MGLAVDGDGIEIVDNPMEALAQYRPGKYDLVLTDHCMPEMTGLELAERIKAMNPEQPVIRLTGFLPSGPMPAVGSGDV
jgi:CheY-like chemotaxis protein